MTSYDLKPLENRLDTIIKLLAMSHIENKNLIDGSPLLDRCDVPRKLIAEFYGTTENSVNIAISRARKKNIKTGSPSKEK